MHFVPLQAYIEKYIIWIIPNSTNIFEMQFIITIV